MKPETKSVPDKSGEAMSTKSRMLEPFIHVWLAGLGAIAKAQTEGPKFFHELIEEGERFQALGRNSAEEGVRGTLDRAHGLVRRVIDELPPVRVLRELESLREKVDAISANIDKLMNERSAVGKAECAASFPGTTGRDAPSA